MCKSHGKFQMKIQILWKASNKIYLRNAIERIREKIKEFLSLVFQNWIPCIWNIQMKLQFWISILDQINLHEAECKSSSEYSFSKCLSSLLKGSQFKNQSHVSYISESFCVPVSCWLSPPSRIYSLLFVPTDSHGKKPLSRKRLKRYRVEPQ